MRLGMCCGVDQVDDYLAAGFDYVEVPAVQLLETGRQVRAEVTNVFFPGSVRLYESEDWVDLARRTIEAADASGVQAMVLGSGAARRAPEAGPEWESRFIKIVSRLVDMAANYGITIWPESLNKSETNVGNDLPSLARRLGSIGTGYTADAYHVLKENPNPDWRLQIPDWKRPLHVHFASFERNIPEPNDPMLTPFFDRLKELKYRHRVSFEGNVGNLTPIESFERLKAWIS
jgi:sugar phosphate isomerase/epimerase